MMTEYIKREAAICIADYATDEHPYDKNPEKAETFSEYNQGWNDACDYIRERLENTEKADVVPVRHGRWDDSGRYTFAGGSKAIRCTECGCALTASEYRLNRWNYCPVCGARMNGGADNGK